MAISLDWYSTPLYYDIIFDAETQTEATFLEEVNRRYSRVKGKAPQRVLEPACGSARLMLELGKRGWETYGFDLSPEMVEFFCQADEQAAGKALGGSDGKLHRAWQIEVSACSHPRQHLQISPD